MNGKIRTKAPQQILTAIQPVGGILQRQCACGNHTLAGSECTQCAKDKGRLQRKLTIGASNDSLEREADQVADQVLSAPAKASISGAAPRIQRFTGHSNGENGAAPASVDRVLANVGRPLEPALRQDMEQRFSHDFSRVRIHTGDAAEQSARDVNAHAYTVGHNMVFGAGRFSPGTHEGRRLIAHELTHVVQQSRVEENSSQSNEKGLSLISPSSFVVQQNDTSQSGLQRSVITSTPPSQGEHSGGEISGELTPEVPPPRARASGPADPNCPDYERGEWSASHREPGPLDSDVERLAPDKLLVADFGVDWRHVKGSTKSDPTLQAWLTTWESNDSYRLSIAGFSDCVGGEGFNTDLRHARASNVEALLGPGAKSRVTFRGMAALGNYVTGNNTPANRARNRGVIIEFHQEFEFPEDKIIVTPQYCGPDSTQWLVDQMNRNRDHPVIKTQREVQWPNWIPFFNLGWNYGALSDFRDLVKAGAPWDFKSNQKQWRSGSGKTCPTAPCDKTVFLCGKCFFYDVPGNIHYGYIGRMASIRAWFLHDRAAAAQVGGVDPAHDSEAIDIGIAIADDGATLCDEIAAHENELNRERTEGCGLCPKAS